MKFLLLIFLSIALLPGETVPTVNSDQATIADQGRKKKAAAKDGRNIEIDTPGPEADPELAKFAIQLDSSPRPTTAAPIATSLPLEISPKTRIALIGNLLLENERYQGHLEALLHQKHPKHELQVRNFSWPADEVDLQPRPDNFGDLDQHLFYFKSDLIIAAFGNNESFAGPEGLPAFKQRLDTFLHQIKSRAYNGNTGSKVVLLSPTAHENHKSNNAADRNNSKLALYTEALKEAAEKHEVAFANVFEEAPQSSPLTSNGSSLNEAGHRRFAQKVYQGIFLEEAPEIEEDLRALVVDKATQFAYRYRPLNTFYYTGDRNKSYGYLDFLPAMRNFDLMVENRNQAIWQTAAGTPSKPDDSKVPELEGTVIARGANEWMTPQDELEAFDVDPRFEVNCFASEEDFPELACPIQMRWDSRGRLWVSCSTTYPHVYPGQEPRDKLIILEDTDADGKADKCTTFADDLHIPLSFVLDGKGGVYLSEQPHLTYLQDTDGDDKADTREILLTGFGCEDSHHSLHDFVWTPGGHLLFRESIFHNSQVETPYGPVRAKNSSWFLYHPETKKLTAFGAYPNTNPWGVVFDTYGNHMASHPVFASTFHATNPAYPEQHPGIVGMQAYSGTCGQDFVEFTTWPQEMQGNFIKARYKPDNRIEIHKWIDQGDHFAEEYVSDLIFSTNLSFIPVDLRFGPRGALYICDWYNPVKGHAQYSLRDPRRDRKAGRIWRAVPKGVALEQAPEIATASIEELLELLGSPSGRIRHWVRRELRSRDHGEVEIALYKWTSQLNAGTVEHTHLLLEALWVHQGINRPNKDLLIALTSSADPLIAAAALGPLRFWHEEIGLDEAHAILKKAAVRESQHVRREAAIAASYLGTHEALEAILPAFDLPHGYHLSYALSTAVSSENLARHWRGTPNEAAVLAHIAKVKKIVKLTPPEPRGANKAFDQKPDLQTREIACIPERLLFTKEKLTVKAGKRIKLIFTNPDATQHNFVLLKKGTSLEEIGTAANEMAKSPEGMKKHFIPKDDRILLASKLLAPDSVEVLRFKAPKEPGIYPYLCTFPGHWILMKGELIVE